MHRDSERHKLFSRRAAMLAGGKALLLSVLAGRMYYLQVVEADRYRTLADENRINFRLLPPPRGRIFDRFGIPVADNQENYRILLVPEQARDVEETLARLGRILPITENETKKMLREVGRKRSFVPVTLRENLAWEDVARIEVNTPDLPGISIDVGQSRFYPNAYEMAHVLGYVAAVSEGETGSDPLLQLPGFRIGKSGIEKVYDRALRGSSGSQQVEVNAYGRVIRELTRTEGQPGTRLELTVDSGLQTKIMERLDGEGASAVVMDVHNGDVLAMVSSPGFDPNAFNRGLSGDEWKALANDEKAPLTNKTIVGQYAPGSTFKMLVALAALEKGAISAESHVYCSGKVRLGNATFHCWKKRGHGSLDVAGAITQSCDVFFYEAAKRVGIERIGEMARRFGLGSKLGIDLPGEKPGLVPSDAWKRAKVGAAWQKGETLITGIGQGFLLATPLQLAVMAARLANGGIAVTPHLTRPSAAEQFEQGPPVPAENMGLVPDHLAIVRSAMENVVNNPHGTAYRARIKDTEFRMAGKTGTVQVRRITKSERATGVVKNKNLPWKYRDHALFVAFAPIQAPRYAAAVVVEHGGGGSSVAAPIARDILFEAQKRNSAGAGEIGPAASTANDTNARLEPASPGPSARRWGRRA